MKDALAIGEQENFEGGWAMMPLHGDCAHYWFYVDQVGTAKRWISSCNVVRAITDSNAGVNPLVKGTFPGCRRCLRKFPI